MFSNFCFWQLERGGTRTDHDVVSPLLVRILVFRGGRALVVDVDLQARARRRLVGARSRGAHAVITACSCSDCCERIMASRWAGREGPPHLEAALGEVQGREAARRPRADHARGGPPPFHALCRHRLHHALPGDLAGRRWMPLAQLFWLGGATLPTPVEGRSDITPADRSPGRRYRAVNALRILSEFRRELPTS